MQNISMAALGPGVYKSVGCGVGHFKRRFQEEWVIHQRLLASEN